MGKRFIIFTIVGFLGCLALGIFVYLQVNGAPKFNTLDFSTNISVPTERKVPVKILVFGDMMLDRKVREQINKNNPEYPFVPIKDFLQGNDIVVANAEGPFTYNNSITVGKKDAPLAFTFDPTILPTLKKLGFTLLGQANNHTLNFGLVGFRQSTSSIEAAGLNWFGDPRNKEVKPYVADVDGEKIAFIGYNEFANQGLDNVLQVIREAKKYSSFIVVYPHWGEEYKTEPNSLQQKTAHTFVDAGADVVIGAHPHVIQSIEMYKNKPIFYSLGNFIFDQASAGPTSRGLAVKISLASDSATYDLFPISITKQQATLMTGEERQTELDWLDVQVGTIIVPRDYTKVQKDLKIIQIGSANISAEFLTTEQERVRGLSGRASLAADAGMFFVFDRSSKWGIWMKDMNFPIDVLWIDDGFKIVDIVENMLPASYPKVYTSHVPARYVLEVPAGTVKKYGIKVGQNVVVK